MKRPPSPIHLALLAATLALMGAAVGASMSSNAANPEPASKAANGSCCPGH